MLTLLGGCVIPIAPEFEDPEVNYPPFVSESDPPAGEIITPPPGEEAEIKVTLADPNVRDHLYVRWIYDYPKYDENITRSVPGPILPPTGTAVREAIRIAPSCALHNIAKGLGQHRITLAVADRDFLRPEDQRVEPDFRLDAVPKGAFRIRATWILNLECK